MKRTLKLISKKKYWKSFLKFYLRCLYKYCKCSERKGIDEESSFELNFPAVAINQHINYARYYLTLIESIR